MTMPGAPKSVGELFPSRFVSYDDLQGRSVSLVIDHIEFENMRSKFDNQERTNAVVYFKGAKKGLCLNKTQAMGIALLAKSELFEAWPGTAVMLSPMIEKGKRTIRISAAPAGAMGGA